MPAAKLERSGVFSCEVEPICTTVLYLVCFEGKEKRKKAGGGSTVVREAAIAATPGPT